MGKIRLFSYYGSKVKMAGWYPEPRFDTIVEPFAGAAGYSCMYPDHNVILYEKNPKIASVLDYLIKATPNEIRELPLLNAEDTVDELPIPQEAKWLIGLWVNGGASSPRNRLSRWAREQIDNMPASFWGPRCRERLAWVVSRIKHWKIYQESWENAARHRGDSTWFIDPPYQKQGKYYPEKSIDFNQLAVFCRERTGQVIVCENEEASWLPFRPLYSMVGASKDGSKRRLSTEVIWTND
jgi:site-specific DNA-adenine methylase